MSVTDSLLAFSLAALLLTLTPGLDTALILRTACAEGGKKAFQAALGIDAGCFVWGALVALGLGALMAVSTLAYTVLKICGAAYLCWLGLQLLMRPRTSFSQNADDTAAHGNWFVKGIHVLIGTLWSVSLIISTHFASAILKRPRVISAMDRATGGLFLCFAARLAFSSR